MTPSPIQRPGNHPGVAPNPNSGVGLQDVLFILFKHKWKVLVLSFLGFAAAGGMAYHAVENPSFESEAKLLVQRVETIDPFNDYKSMKETGGPQAVAVMDTEVEILRSADLFLEVARRVGPEKIIPTDGERPTLGSAGFVISKNVGISASRGSEVIHLDYRHADPEVVVEVLRNLVDVYLEKHLEIHRATKALQELIKQTDQARLRLDTTDLALQELRASAGVVSVTESMAALESRRNLVDAAVLATEAELAHQRTWVQHLEQALGLAREEEAGDAGDGDGEELAAGRADARARAEYRDLAGQLETFMARRNELLLLHPDNHPRIRDLTRRIDDVEQRRFDLADKHPALAGAGAVEGSTRNGPGGPMGPDIRVERAQLHALEAKLQKSLEQRQQVMDDYQRISEAGRSIGALERRRAIEEQKHANLQQHLEEALAANLLGPSNMPNITEIQKPTIPVKSVRDTTLKTVAGLAGAGIATGIGLAFLLELLDRRVSRPMEIPTRLQLPLMISIPYFRAKDGLAKRIGGKPDLADDSDIMLPPVSQNGLAELSREGRPNPFIARYAEAICDRVMFNFEVNHLTHKPKLVAVTGLTRGAGASTLAAGVAKAFAEEGRRKVLLVDLNPHGHGDGDGDGDGGNGFPRDRDRDPSDSLARAIESSHSEDFRKCSRSFYFASATTRRASRRSRSLAPIELHQLMPSLNGSDFDYIIFDMPPVDPTSPTLAMAGFMDKVLLVLDAEKTTRESLRWGFSELEKGRADVSCIYNKARSHAPRWVVGEVA